MSQKRIECIGRVTRILYLKTRWKSRVSFTPWPLSPISIKRDAQSVRTSSSMPPPNPLPRIKPRLFRLQSIIIIPYTFHKNKTKPDYVLLGCDTVGLGKWEKRLRRNLVALSSTLKKQTSGFSENLVPVYDASSQTTVMLVSFAVRNSNLSSHKINDSRIYSCRGLYISTEPAFTTTDV